MESSLTINSIIALFGAMVALAMIPSLSVLAVVARSAALGFSHGLATALGIVVGDFIFIILAIYSLSAVAENMGGLLLLVKYGGGIYLIWSGIKLICDRSKTIEVTKVATTSRLSSFFSGLSITLGDQKAIFFYLSFFPAFLDLENVSLLDAIIVMAIATVAVGGVKVGYAYLGNRVKFLRQSSGMRRGINLTAGSVLVVSGVFLLIKR